MTDPWTSPAQQYPSAADSPAPVPGPAGSGAWSGSPADVVTTAAHPGARANAPLDDVDPFRVGGQSGLRTPPPRPGTQYGAGVAPGTWGPPPVWAAPPKTDPLAIAALATGVGALVTTLLIGSPVALVLGIVALRRTSRTGAPGRGLAVGGIATGAVGMLGLLAFVAFVVAISVSGSM